MPKVLSLSLSKRIIIFRPSTCETSSCFLVMLVLKPLFIFYIKTGFRNLRWPYFFLRNFVRIWGAHILPPGFSQSHCVCITRLFNFHSVLFIFKTNLKVLILSDSILIDLKINFTRGSEGSIFFYSTTFAYTDRKRKKWKTHICVESFVTHIAAHRYPNQKNAFGKKRNRKNFPTWRKIFSGSRTDSGFSRKRTHPPLFFVFRGSWPISS